LTFINDIDFVEEIAEYHALMRTVKKMIRAFCKRLSFVTLLLLLASPPLPAETDDSQPSEVPFSTLPDNSQNADSNSSVL
jgi:hypothetical protein